MKATLSRNYKSKSAALRDQLNHPVVDADGHTVEFEPGVLDYLKDIAGSEAVDRYKSSPEGGFHLSVESHDRARAPRMARVQAGMVGSSDAQHA